MCAADREVSAVTSELPPDVPPSRPDRRRVLRGAALLAGAASLLGTLRPQQGRAAAAPLDVRPAPLREVTGRLAFITGGASGIGLGMARAFSAAGMRVVIAYAQDEQLAGAMAFFPEPHAGVFPVKLDVTDRDAWARVADEITRRHGSVHLLCNNASMGLSAGIARAAYRDWDQALAVNLGGVFNGLHTFLPRLLAQDDPAHVVATSSMSGLLPVGGAGIYNTTKIAVIGLLESLRAELEDEDLGVSVFCPGLVHTNLPPGDADRPRPPGMDPLDAGQQVLRGVRNNDLFILSHPEFRDGLQERFEAILASVADGEAPPATRLAAEQSMIRNPLYAQERDRRRAARR
jgi:NAD(P)-dependent dehydrogenase (short-subunit alcohol dehydrogenase family)